MKRRDFLIGTTLLAGACVAPRGIAKGGFVSDRMLVTVRGSGPDVLLVPGLTSSPEIWERLVTALPGYRYHLVHVCGFAGADVGGNAGNGPVLLPIANELVRYISQADLDAPAIIGHSMGGTLAMMVASGAPDSVSRVMVVDMVPFMGIFFGPPGTTSERVRPVAEATRRQISGRSARERQASIEASIAGMVRNPAARAGPMRHAMESDPVLGAQVMYDLITTDLRSQIAAIKAPLVVLYVNGPNIPLNDGQMDAVYRASFAGAPQAILRRVPDAYHFVMLDQPERFTQEVSGFLGRSATRPAT